MPSIARALNKWAICCIFVLSHMGKERAMLYWLTIAILRLLMLLGRIRLNVVGADCIPKSGPVILLPRHSYWADIPAVALLAAIYARRHVTFLAKKEYFKSKIIAWLFDRWGAISLRRGVADSVAVRKAAESLREGKLICVYPEGTRNPRLGELSAGWALIARHSEVTPVVIVVEIYWTARSPLRANIFCSTFSYRPDEKIRDATARVRAVLEGYECNRWD